MKFVTVFLKWKKIAIGYFSSQFLGGDREKYWRVIVAMEHPSLCYEFADTT